jgi:hypothetical protein
VDHRANDLVGNARLRDPIVLPLTGLEQIVDLNYLYHRQQISHYMAENAACQCSRLVHLALAKAYATRIEAAILAGTRAVAIHGISA